jgi:hypothetical protein
MSTWRRSNRQPPRYQAFILSAIIHRYASEIEIELGMDLVSHDELKML